MTEELLSVREAAKTAGRTPETIRRWVWDGKLPAQKLGNQLFVRRADLEKAQAMRAAEGGAAYPQAPSRPRSINDPVTDQEVADRLAALEQMIRVGKVIQQETGGKLPSVVQMIDEERESH